MSKHCLQTYHRGLHNQEEHQDNDKHQSNPV